MGRHRPVGIMYPCRRAMYGLARPRRTRPWQQGAFCRRDTRWKPWPDNLQCWRFMAAIRQMAVAARMAGMELCYWWSDCSKRRFPRVGPDHALWFNCIRAAIPLHAAVVGEWTRVTREKFVISHQMLW